MVASIFSRIKRRSILWLILGMMGFAGVAFAWTRSSKATRGTSAANVPGSATRVARIPNKGSDGILASQVKLNLAQQATIGLKTSKAEMGEAIEVISAPGKITPDESRYAFIPPLTPGVVRSVSAQIGMAVKAGDVLATLDSPEYAQARLDLLIKNQELEVAETRASWQASITTSTLELIQRLAAGDTSSQIQSRFEGRAVGQDRERLLTADSQRRVTHAAMDRNKELLEASAVSLAKYQVVVAEYEAALATYQSLMDRVGVEARLANTRCQQDLRAAEIAVRVARSRLRALGVDPNSPDVLPSISHAMDPTANAPQTPGMGQFSIRAPFDGTILEREMIVPGVAVSLGQKIFTIADLSTVWIEANVHESQFGPLARSANARITLQSPAYPGREFEGEVIYTGDVVEDVSRTVKLLARAVNPERLLKPGMFVDVKIRSRSGRSAILIPDSALMIDGKISYVFLRTGTEQFERREVTSGPNDGGKVEILGGLDPGAEVVVDGAFKLKAEAIRISAS